jgi:hypothetical protein
MKKLPSASPIGHQSPKQLLPQQAEILQAFLAVNNDFNTNNKNEQWYFIQKWVKKRLHPWFTQYTPIADELAQEGLIALWLAIKNNPMPTELSPATYVAYYWHMVATLEQKARSVSQKEVRYWRKQAYVSTTTDGNSPQAWEEYVYFNSQQLQSSQVINRFDAELADIAQCVKQLFAYLKTRASMGEKASWFLKKRFHLDEERHPASTTSAENGTETDPSHQKVLAQTLGISQQGVSTYEKRLLKQCQRWLMPYYPF